MSAGAEAPGGDGRLDGIRAELDGLGAELTALVRALHDEPELGFDEHASVARIADLLAAHGYRAEVGAFGLDTAFRVTAGAADGPHFALIAEYDALPGVGHACGHNVIAAAAVGAFLAAAPHVAEVGGRLSLVGTPAEENGGGKELIIRAGGFDGVDAAAMIHPTAGDVDAITLAPQTTGVRRIAVTYHGRAAHAAGTPWLGRNALDAAVSAYQGVAQLRQHILPTDRIHGIITDGGAAPNIVPERAAALFYVRSAAVDSLRELTDRVVAVLEGAALATGTRSEITLDPVPPYLPLRTNRALVERWAAALAAGGRIAAPAVDAAPQGGPSTDMGNLSLLIPAIHPSIGLGGPDDLFPHSADYAAVTVLPAAVVAMTESAAALAATALDYLADADLRAAVAAEFAEAGGSWRWSD